MRYETGEDVRLWDRVAWGSGRGIVVFSIDSDEYTLRFPKEQWSYLRAGAMVDSAEAGLVHEHENPPPMEFVARGGPPTPAEWAELRRLQIARSGSEWRGGTGPSVEIGAVNGNGQICLGHRGIGGTDHLQLAYRLECGHCGLIYGANGSDAHERLCPQCQGGRPGIEY
jgi:hypothetical protein